MKGNLKLILLDIRSVQNTSSLFRTADCAGVSKIYLVGTTPTPIDRFNRVRADFAKISLGAEKTVPYEYFADFETLAEKLKKEKCNIVALEQNKKSIDYKEYKIKGDTALVLGTEVSGVPKEILEKCDEIIEIPMLGKKESLNVSVAGAVAIFRLLDL
ncbi:MAG: TrmH family RNA methyltransferase [Candidatus Paceibacterota bacterium]|jgi:tRNA G18 (ribose-2'-O)-methylase SpoU